MNINELKMQIVLQCSPLLAGLKISNLLITGSDDEDRVRHLFKNSGIATQGIYKDASKVTYLLYRPEELEGYLKRPKVSRLLCWLGYEQIRLYEVFDLFCSRYKLYRQEKKKFPHEMGLLLGYPVEDVYGFIVNKGKNDLYTGYWKIYDNLSDTLKLFEQFNQANEFMVRQVCLGVNISELITMKAIKWAGAVASLLDPVSTHLITPRYEDGCCVPVARVQKRPEWNVDIPSVIAGVRSTEQSAFMRGGAAYSAV